MPHSIFVSDLHLAPERPAMNEVFFRFAGEIAGEAQALYILGDLFEYWAGDDDLVDPFNASVADALKRLSTDDTKVFLMHGNRDLLLGQAFASRCGAELLPDPTVVEIHGTHTLLLHGDTLCTDDVDYQRFRTRVRNPDFQANFLAQPLATRKAQLRGMRQQSEQSKRDKTAEIMDVSPATVEQTLREYGYPRLIHGHTHRPARHVHVVDGQPCERWVLNDWYESGGYLRCDADGCTPARL